MNLFTTRSNDSDIEAEYLVEMLLKKHTKGELNLVAILLACKQIYRLGQERGSHDRNQANHS